MDMVALIEKYQYHEPPRIPPPTPQEGWDGYPGPAYPPAEGEPLRVLHYAPAASKEETDRLAEGMPPGAVEWLYLVEEQDERPNEHGEVRLLTPTPLIQRWQFLRAVLDFRPHLLHIGDSRGAEFAEWVGVPKVEVVGDQTAEECLARYRAAVLPITDIVVLAHNELEVTSSCVHHLLAHTWVPYRLVLVDNGSMEPVGDLFRQVALMVAPQPCLVLEPGENLGCPGGRQLAYEHLAAPYFAWVDNDMLVPPGWLGPLVRQMHTNPAIGAIGAWSNVYSDRWRWTAAQPQDMAASNNLYRTQAVRDAEEEPGRLHCEPFERLQGRSDTDLLWRIKEAGYELWLDGQVEMMHLGGPLRDGLGQGLTRRSGEVEAMHQADVAFRRKWLGPGVRIDQECQPTPST